MTDHATPGSVLAGLINQARQELDREFPDAWMPHEQNQPSEIAGVFKRLEQGNTARGPAHIVVIEDEHGVEHAIWLLHTALRNQFSQVKPAIGEAIAVRYLGKRVSTATGNEYDDYKVAVVRSPGQLDWSVIDPTTPVAAAQGAPPSARAAQPPAATPHHPPVAAGAPCPSCGNTGGSHSPTCPYVLDDLPF